MSDTPITDACERGEISPRLAEQWINERKERDRVLSLDERVEKIFQLASSICYATGWDPVLRRVSLAEISERVKTHGSVNDRTGGGDE